MAVRLKPSTNPYISALDQVQAEIDRRTKERAKIAAVTARAQEKEPEPANDNLLNGFSLLPAYQCLIEGQLGSYDWRAFFSGRGTGKSWAVADGAIYRAYHIPNLRVAFVRMRDADLDKSSRIYVVDRLKAWGLWDVVARWNNGKIVFDNGSEILFLGLWKSGKPDGVKSLEGVNLTIIEEAEELSTAALEALTPTVMRTAMSEIWAIWNPKSKESAIHKELRGPFPPERSIIKRVHRSDNPYFTDKMRREMEKDFKKNPLRAAYIWDGEFEPSAEGAMWDRAMLDYARQSGLQLKRDMIQRVVIGVDPAGSGKKSDEVGIVVGASLNVKNEFGDNILIVLGDYTMSKQSPREWALTIGKLAVGWKADCVVAESNYGGELVRSNLMQNGVKARVIMRHSHKSKQVRAEPVAAMYDAGRVWHYRDMPALEEQFLHMTPQGYAVDGSPDRCFVKGTLIKTERGDVPIEEITKNDFILTRSGMMPVKACGLTAKNQPVLTVSLSNGASLTGTGNHPIWSDGSWKRMDALVFGDKLLHEKEMSCQTKSTRSKKRLSLTELRLFVIQKVKAFLQKDTFNRLVVEKGSVEFARCTGSYGNITEGQFQRDIKSITSTETFLTTKSKTLSACHQRSTHKDMRTNTPKHGEPLLTKYAKRHPSGTEALRGESLTLKWQKPLGRKKTESYPHVSSALSLAFTELGTKKRFIAANAYRLLTGLKKAIMKPAHAVFAIKHTQQSNTANQEHAPISVVRVCDSGLSDVYNLSVANAPEYFANGVLVHNCDAAVFALLELSGKVAQPAKSSAQRGFKNG